MNRTEWISSVIVDLHETFDLWRVSESASRLAHRWWRIMHPLQWEDELAIYMYVDGDDRVHFKAGTKSPF
jgi:hypothetical protein